MLDGIDKAKSINLENIKEQLINNESEIDDLNTYIPYFLISASSISFKENLLETFKKEFIKANFSLYYKTEKEILFVLLHGQITLLLQNCDVYLLEEAKQCECE